MRTTILNRRLPALLLSLVLALSLAACADNPRPSDLSASEAEAEVVPEPPAPTYVLVNTIKDPGRSIKGVRLTEEIGKKYALNSDTVGWLQVPGTHIDDVVLHCDDPDDYNNYYYRRNFNKQYDFNGCFYADFRNKFGDGSVEELGNNTVIYGHTMSPDINGVMFAPLKYFAEEEFARKTPYVFFSTREKDLIWEVFAVFYATIDLPYNLTGQPEAEFEHIIKESKARSLYDYDVEVTGKDKILTFSTCTYFVPTVEGRLAYPNDYRYVVMAKLVSKANATKTEAALKVNPSPAPPTYTPPKADAAQAAGSSQADVKA